MQYFLKPFFTAIIIFLFASCQKQFTADETPVNPATGDSTLLVKYFEVDSLLGGVIDTTLVAKYTYDANKRLTAIFTVFSNNPASNAIFFEEVKFLYNGVDTFPYKVTSWNQAGSLPDDINKDTTFCFYNGSARLIKDSTISYEGTDTAVIKKNEYTYATGYIIRKHIGIFENIDTVFQTFANNDLTRQITTDYDNASQTLYDFTFMYDDHPNPFNITAINTLDFIANADAAIHSTPQRNNRTSIMYVYSPQNASTETTTILANYVYKANGYPSSTSQTYGIDGSTERNYKGFFEYAPR